MQTKKVIPDRALRVAFAGDSITWGDGMLDDGFVGTVATLMRTQYAETILAAEMTVVGRSRVRKSRKFYSGEALELLGEGSAVRFELVGDELSVVLAAERGGASAAVGLYVDGELYDTFDYGPSAVAEATVGAAELRFVGDGETTRFDLGRPFTFGHQVLVDGRVTAGALNVRGYGAVFPEAHEWMVIRRYVSEGNDRPVVSHALWFREPPPEGTVIDVSYSYGESVAYAKTTVGEIEERLDSPLESRFGDGGIAYDPARPVPVSSGLDYRESDSRAVRTWRFAGRVQRVFELRIVGPGQAPGAEQSQHEPGLIVNMATNRYHHLMNAGIGGWTTKLFNSDPGLRSAERLAAWKPDIVILGLGTNDDWDEGNGFVASRHIAGVSKDELLRTPALWLKECRFAGMNRYDVETAELIVAAVSERSVTFDRTNASFCGVKPGDLVLIGDYFGDNRNVLARIIEHWDEQCCTATFIDLLEPTSILLDVQAFVGQTARIKRIDGFAERLTRMIATIRAVNPDVVITLVETGMCNFYTRLLIGYPEKLRQLAHEQGLELIPIYRPLLEWQYAQRHDTPVYIGAESSVISTGVSQYELLTASSQEIGAATGTMNRHWSVVVDGKERYGHGCRIEGGYAITFRPDLEDADMTIANWDGRSRNPKMMYRFIPSRLAFTRDVPPPGARIEVAVASAKWSWDDTHLGMPGGDAVYAEQITAAVKRILPRIL